MPNTQTLISYSARVFLALSLSISLTSCIPVARTTVQNLTNAAITVTCWYGTPDRPLWTVDVPPHSDVTFNDPPIRKEYIDKDDHHIRDHYGASVISGGVTREAFFRNEHIEIGTFPNSRIVVANTDIVFEYIPEPTKLSHEEIR